MKKLVLSMLAAAAIATTPAVAADLPAKAAPVPVPVFNWTGFYVGSLSGAGWAEAQWSAPGVSTRLTGSDPGGTLGGVVGFNWQAPGSPWVLGIEGDLSWANIKATNAAGGGCSGVAPCTAEVKWFGTVRGRVGHTAGGPLPLLFYLTGGVAVAEIENSQLGLSPLAHAKDTKAGWVAGAGVEAAFTARWSGKAEFVRARIGETPFCPIAGCGVVVVSDSTKITIVRGGMNWRF